MLPLLLLLLAASSLPSTSPSSPSTSSLSPSSCPSTCSCSSLRVDCSRRGLSHLPASIPPDTTHLDVSGNDIEYLNATRLPPNITVLNASDNRVTSIDPALFNNTNLTVLLLRKNRISTVSQACTGLSRLDKLDLSHNSLLSLSPDDLLLLSSVRLVDLSRNSISSWPQAPPIRTSILERLDLASNHLHSLPPSSFPFHLLRTLRLNRNRLKSIDRNTFKGLSSIQSIDLSRNRLLSLSALSFELVPSLTHLSLARNRIESVDDGALFGLSFLQRLNLSSNALSSVTAGWLFGTQHLQNLDLSNNKIESLEASVWSQCPSIRWLSLHGNRLSSLPSGAFRSLPELENLILSSNSIHTLHKTSLTGLDRLHTLDVSSNSLALCIEDGAVLHNTSLPYLKTLIFAKNQLTVLPSRAFSRFPALEDLDLSSNPIASIYPGAFDPLRLRKLEMSTHSLICDCHISWFPSWLRPLPIDQRSVEAVCAHPIPLRGIALVAIDTANLTCVDDSPRARITVHPPPLLKTISGTSASFRCQGYGLSPVTLQWRVVESGKPRLLTHEAAGVFIHINRTSIFNGTSTGHEMVDSSLTLSQVSLSDTSEYQCTVSNQYSKDYSIRSLLEVLQSPQFLKEPDDSTVMVGQNAKIICSATGVPTPVLRWSKTGSFPAAEQRRLHVRPHDDHLYVLNVSVEDQGIYTCHASNSVGSVQASATLRVFANSFSSPLSPQSLLPHETLLLDCMADLDLPLQHIQWTKDGIPLEDAPRLTFKAHRQILLILKAEPSDSGEYGCSLMAGDTVLISQSALVTVSEKDEGQGESVSEKRAQMTRGKRWLVSAGGVAGLVIFCLSCSLIFYRRKMKRRQNEPPPPTDV